jgi:hypothetical protein
VAHPKKFSIPYSIGQTLGTGIDYYCLSDRKGLFQEFPKGFLNKRPGNQWIDKEGSNKNANLYFSSPLPMSIPN